MARSNSGLRLTYAIDSSAVVLGFRQTASRATPDVLEVGLRAAEEIMLPAARQRAPHLVRHVLAVKGTRSGWYLTTDGRMRNIVGYLNFGGTVRARIVPRADRQGRGGRPKALFFGGRWVAYVATPRRFKGKHFFEAAIRVEINRYIDRVEADLARRIQARVS